ncbi:hypothetical protein BGW39_009956 [Mortierella sp. 14UC]|nr:hypothetical protein BGW39_009956 [Mortierella sp. 14UC]
MSPTLYRFTTAEGLVHLLDRKTINTNTFTTSDSDITPSPHPIATSASPENLLITTVHNPASTLNGTAPTVSNYATKEISSFHHLVLDFDETITDHDTTSSFDTLACKVRPGTDYQEPQMTWSEILQAYLDDLEKVDVSDLCHLNRPLHPPATTNASGEATASQGKMEAPTVQVSSPSLPQAGQEQEGQLHHPQPKSNTPPLQTTTTNKQPHKIQPPSAHHHLLDPKVRELQCHIDGRTFTPEPELPVPKFPSLQPWIHSQVRKRAVEKVSLDRVYESGNLVGLTKEQIREFGREHVRLRPGMVQFLKAFVEEQDRVEQEVKARESQVAGGQGGDNESSPSTTTGSHHPSGSGSVSASPSSKYTRGQLWILSVNWSQDLIRGAMDQVFGSEEATVKYLPDSNLICSNLEFAKEGHETLARRRKSEPSTTIVDNNNSSSADLDNTDTSNKQGENACVHHTSGKVDANILTGTDKLHAFRDIQRRFAAQHNLAPFETKWAFFGDSTTDLGCLVEADVGIIIGKSKSLLSECERSGIQVVDLEVRK